MHRRMDSVSKSKQEGIALIEALIAITLFSFGILALVGVQAAMSKNVVHSKLRGEASFLANQLIGQMWVDQANLANYEVEEGECANAANTRCTNWMTAVRQMLPSGDADVTVDGSTVNITMRWQVPGQSEVPSQFKIDAYITN